MLQATQGIPFSAHVVGSKVFCAKAEEEARLSVP